MINLDIRETLEIATLIGAILAFISSSTALIVSIRKDRKEAFINVVTTARKEYIQELRKLLVEFCYEAYCGESKNKNLQKIGFQLKFMMNPAGTDYKDWDYDAVELIEKIITNNNNKKDNEKNEKILKQFVALMQSWLALEWNGMMTEGKKGILSNEEKEDIRNDFLSEYKKYCKNEGIEI